VHSHNIIYGLMEAAKQTLEDAIDPVVEERETGTAEVLETFTLTLNRKDRADGMGKHTVVAGARVVSGVATANSLARVMRRGEQVHDGKVISLRHFKQEVRSMKKGSECGMILHNFSGLEKGDLVFFYETVSRKPSLYEEEAAGEG
jgi:translation initiation factor IF-2